MIVFRVRSHVASPCQSRHGKHYYRPQRSWGKVMFLQASVILLTGGGCLPQYMLGYTPREHTPPGPGTSPRPGTPPRSRHPLGLGTPPGPGTSGPGTPPNFFWDFICIFLLCFAFFPLFSKFLINYFIIGTRFHYRSLCTDSVSTSTSTYPNKYFR